ncbi:MAG: LpxI family protein [Desulfobacteraceae bacterium]|nr:MAG: LpxI family protein [Desulfobacteraceae bacterium]
MATEINNIIGLIAGGGTFPLQIAETARNRGLTVIALAHEGDTDPGLTQKVDKIVWIKLGQLGKIINVFKKNGVQQALMAGTINKRRMFSKIKPDLKGLALISKMAILHDDGILRAVARELEAEGIEMISSTFCLPELLTPPGLLTKRKPNKEEKEDIQFGWEMAKALGKLDIGQCVVVRRKTVLAVEAIEGTDETIRRGGRLAQEKAVIVKVSKPNQDLRFDVPTVGLQTIRTMLEVQAAVLALEADKTLLFDKKEMLALADKSGIVIIAL